MVRVKEAGRAVGRKEIVRLRSAMRRARLRFESEEDRRLTAIHEAGHAFIALAFGCKDVSVILGARRTRIVLRSSEGQRALSDLLGLLALAGAGAEMLGFAREMVPVREAYVPKNQTDRDQARRHAYSLDATQVEDTLAMWKAVLFSYMGDNFEALARIAELIFATPFANKQQLLNAAGNYDKPRDRSELENELLPLAICMKENPFMF